jgi:hypothetical protein
MLTVAGWRNALADDGLGAREEQTPPTVGDREQLDG